MYISKVSLVNYRNFSNAKFLFKKGINTIIGENGSGKTNLFKAIRLLLDENLLSSAYKLNEKDFHRGLSDGWKGHWVIISLEFEDISSDEAIQSLFLHGAGNHESGAVSKATYSLIFRPKIEIRQQLSKLQTGDTSGLETIVNSITIDDYETVFRGKSSADFNNADTYKLLVGDFDNVVFPIDLENPIIGTKIPHQLSINKEVSFTFIKALRDVVADFQNNRTNPLLKLLKSKSGDLDLAALKQISDKVIELNDKIENLEDVQEVRIDIKDTIKENVGETYSPSSLSIKSDLPTEADKLFQSLKLFIGESYDSYEGAIHELSLGGANLIYLTLKILEFKYQKAKESFANFLLIEEPEAHIHTHIQKTLFDKVNYPNTQIIYSTHSTHLSEVSNIENMNILARNGINCEIYHPYINLKKEQIRNVQRYLDAIRSNLLFAKGVILVEGDAEEILIPVLVKKVFGISLDELGISLINIRSTGFENVAVLFHDDRIRRKCSIVTDLDTSIIDCAIDSADSPPEIEFKRKCEKSQKSGAERKIKLTEFIKDNEWVKVFYTEYTFEVDFVMAGNVDGVKKLVDEIYKKDATKDNAIEDLDSEDIAKVGRRILTMANNQGKGWFAIMLSNHVNHLTFIPSNILKAISFAKHQISPDTWFNIFNYRINQIELHDTLENAVHDYDKLKDELKKFKDGLICMNELKKFMLENFKDSMTKQFVEA